MACVNDTASCLPAVLLQGGLLGAVSATAVLSSTTASAGQLTGASIVIFWHAGGTNPGTYTTRTAVQMINDTTPPMQTSQTWLLFLGNQNGTGTLTLAGGTGVTIGGTTTVAANVGRFYLCTVTAATTITMTGQALSVTVAA